MSLTLEQLPHDVLVMLMQYLSVDDLLACRLVCKWLDGLALHRDVWRRRRIYVNRFNRRCMCAVLQLAPCAATIVYHSKARCSPSAMTRCAATRLELFVGEQFFNAAECALVVRNQELLGRMTSVQLVRFVPTSLSGAEVLLRTLAVCSGLELLDIECWGYVLPNVGHLVVSRPRPPTLTLKYFRCDRTEASASFVNAVLARHAATLEEVHLVGTSSDHIAEGTAELLAVMPKLRELTCDALHSMTAVARCGSLRDVKLQLTTARFFIIEEVRMFLEQATQLRTISLDLSELLDVYQNQEGLSAGLIASLSASPRPLLQQLSVSSLVDITSLVRALPRLPGLRRLDLSGSCDNGVLGDELLLGITPTTAPALRVLRLTDDYGDRCAHDWLHEDAVKEILRANPSLHILLQLFACELDDCEACNQGCHGEISWQEQAEQNYQLGLYSHDPDECPSPEYHRADMDVWWRHFSCISA